MQNTCPYSYIFETSPPPGGQVLRKYDSIPRPFVMEPPLETKIVYHPGEKLVFQLVLMGRAINYLPYFIIVFRELGEIGIGKGRRKYTLDSVKAVDLYTGEKSIIYDREKEMITNLDMSVSGDEIVDLSGYIVPQDNPDDIKIRFLTMTRLKFEKHYTLVPEFHIIIRNLLRRLSSISYFHHGTELHIDFKGIIKKAKEVSLVNNDTRWVDWERYSSRQDMKMNMGGIVGEAVYRGKLAEFWPMLKLAEQVHVGKGAVFGLGKIEMA